MARPKSGLSVCCMLESGSVGAILSDDPGSSYSSTGEDHDVTDDAGQAQVVLFSKQVVRQSGCLRVAGATYVGTVDWQWVP